MIECRECGKKFKLLSPHINRAHQMDSASYRQRWQIPAGTPLASVEYVDAARARAKQMIADGILTYDHLPAAVQKSRTSGRGQRTFEDLQRQADIAKRIGPKLKYKAGEKLKNGRDAVANREYQRKHRLRKNEK